MLFDDLLVVLCIEIAGIGILPALDPYVSARWHAQFLRNDAHPDRIFTYELPRSWTYGLAFYLGRELPEWNPQDPEPALVLTTPKGLEEMTKLGRFHGDLEEPYKGILYVPAVPGERHTNGLRCALGRDALQEEIYDWILIILAVFVGHVGIVLPVTSSLLRLRVL